MNENKHDGNFANSYWYNNSATRVGPTPLKTTKNLAKKDVRFLSYLLFPFFILVVSSFIKIVPSNKKRYPVDRTEQYANNATIFESREEKN